MRKKFIKDNVYGYHFWLIWNCDVEKSKSWFENRYGCELNHGGNPEASVFGEIDGSTGVALWLESDKLLKDGRFILDHEIHHLHFHALETAGIKLSEETQEAYAYYFQYLKKKIMKELTRVRRKTTKKVLDKRKKKE